MDKQERIEFAKWLLERVEVDRQNPVVGDLLAARWATGAFAHALMAHSGNADIETEIPASMYATVMRMDREEGGGEKWRRPAFFAYELSHHFYLRGLPLDEVERKIAEVVQATAELLERLDPGGEAAVHQTHPNPLP